MVSMWSCHRVLTCICVLLTATLTSTFAGHMGNRASKFAARHLQSLFHILVTDSLRDGVSDDPRRFFEVQPLPAASDAWRTAYELRSHRGDDGTTAPDRNTVLFDNASLSQEEWKLGDVVASLRQSFVQTNDYFERNHDLYPNDQHTGTTATVVLLFPTAIVVGNVGDSRAVLCCDRHPRTNQLVALPLTVDHTPYNAAERGRLEALGGTVVHTGEKLRVNGAIAVTRSIGDFPFGPLLSAVPDIFVFSRVDSSMQRKSDARSAEDASTTHHSSNACHILYSIRTGARAGAADEVSVAAAQQFIVLASDGLFDVMTNDEVVRFVCASIVEIMTTTASVGADSSGDSGDRAGGMPIDAYHIAAKLLAQEAYVRGSSDNIGVCIINLFAPQR